MRVHERHHHLDQIADGLHHELHLIVVMRLTSRRLVDATDSQKILERVAQRTERSRRSESDGSSR